MWTDGCNTAPIHRPEIRNISNMRIAGNTLGERATNEVKYYDQTRRDPYGLNVARMDSHGGWIATPSDLTAFFIHIPRLGSPDWGCLDGRKLEDVAEGLIGDKSGHGHQTDEIIWAYKKVSAWKIQRSSFAERLQGPPGVLAWVTAPRR